MRTAFPYEPQKTVQLASPVVNWSLPFTSGSGSATLWPGAVAPVKVWGEEPEFDQIEISPLERMFEEARRQWRYYTPPKPALDVEQDIWVQLPPKREFTVTMNVVFQGRGKPDPLPDELLSDVA